MPKDRDDQLNKGHPDGEAFSLEEILAEYKGRGGGEAFPVYRRKVSSAYFRNAAFSFYGRANVSYPDFSALSWNRAPAGLL